MKITKIIKKYGFWKTLQKGLGGIFFVLFRPIILAYINRFMPVDDKKLLFLSKPSFSDNSKALFLYMVKLHPEYNYIWLIDNDIERPSFDYMNVSYYMTKSYWHKGYPLKTIVQVLTSKYLFFTHNSPVEFLPKRPEQFVVNLWHGCGYKGQIKREWSWIEKKKCDIALVPGPLFVKTKSQCWGVGDDIIKPIGYPRYDLLKTDNDHGKKFASDLKRDNSLLIIWMPTFRQSLSGDYPEAHMGKEYDLPLLSNDDDLIKLNEICSKKKISLCIKRHPSQEKYRGEELSLSNITFIDNLSLVKADTDLYELLRYTDALISDYSSVSVDYLLLNRPIAFALDDYNQYLLARGFVFDEPLKYMPGHHLFVMKDLIQFFCDVESNCDLYANNRIEMMSIMHNPCDNYCERVWDCVVSLSTVHKEARN